MNNSLVGNITGKNTTETLTRMLQGTTFPHKPPKKNKIKRLYEDDDFVIDIFTDAPIIRISIFTDGHFEDEIFVKK